MTVRWLAAGVVCLALGCAPKGQGEQADGAPQGQHVDRFRGEPPQDEDVGKRAPAVPRTAGPAGEAATAQEGSRARAEGQIAKKIEKMPSVGVHKALGSDLEAEPLMARDVAMQDAFGAGEGPMHNVLGAPNAKLGAAMSGVGDELAVGQGAGGLGLAGGTGTGGGGQGFGRIHGMGRIDTGGGRGTKASLGGKARNKKKVRVRSGKASLAGYCKEADIMRVVNARQSGIQFCYEKELGRNPELEGKVQVNWRIGLDGSVAKVLIESSTLNNKTVEGCMVRQIQRWKFP
ncbi:MAG: AgmX/PglI C-terminal domain-containing protein, partial [Myxococcales bacterium]|nr:AgmX/PglI C-terminal domain-containing protein [Myxococcales bacterium]